MPARQERGQSLRSAATLRVSLMSSSLCVHSGALVTLGATTASCVNLHSHCSDAFPKYFPHPAKVGVCWSVLLESILEHMPRRLNNWTYRDLTDFLKENGFSYFEPVKGSHEAWIKLGENGEPDRIVEVNFTHSSYPLRTLKTMIRQSGIDQQEWIKWAGA
jgi:predicted RNA binding protein YcfA (HicA-like mRNA interferase family)